MSCENVKMITTRISACYTHSCSSSCGGLLVQSFSSSFYPATQDNQNWTPVNSGEYVWVLDFQANAKIQSAKVGWQKSRPAKSRLTKSRSPQL